MRAILTLIGSLLIFSWAQAQMPSSSPISNQYKNTQNPIAVTNSQTVGFAVKNESDLIKKILIDKDLSQIQKLRSTNGDKASYGGATSGGGDDLGLEVQRVVGAVAQMIENDTEIYQPKIKNLLLVRAATAKIIITDEELPASMNGLTQSGAAFSISDGQQSVILIQREKWTAIADPLIKDSLIHHELAVLAGLEFTGDYRYTNLFQKKRAQFWELLKAKKFVCSFNLFKSKSPYEGFASDTTESRPVGKLVGSAAAINDTFGASGGWDILYDLTASDDSKSNRAVIVRYVVSSNGYLRAEFSEADVQRQSNSSWKMFSNMSKRSKEKVYFTPYDLIDRGHEATIEAWEGFFIQVSCSKL